MKKALCFLLSVVVMLTFVLAGCGNTDSEKGEEKSTTSSEATEKATEAVTESPETEAPATEAPATSAPETESSDHEYTGIELADMNLKDIIAIMGGEYETIHDLVTPAFSSEPIDYIHNDTALPGFYFDCYGAPEDFDTNGFGIALKDSAKLNDTISADMTYNELAAVIGDFDVQAVGGAWSLVYYTTVDGCGVSFIIEPNEYLYQNATEGQLITSDMLKEANPNLNSIALRTDR